VHGWISNFTMPTDTLASLENAMFNEYSGDDYAPIKKWIAENQEWVDSLTS
jgi:glycine betaine/proline transport system substrate-binding protein